MSSEILIAASLGSVIGGLLTLLVSREDRSRRVFDGITFFSIAVFDFLAVVILLAAISSPVWLAFLYLLRR